MITNTVNLSSDAIRLLDYIKKLRDTVNLLYRIQELNDTDVAINEIEIQVDALIELLDKKLMKDYGITEGDKYNFRGSTVEFLGFYVDRDCNPVARVNYGDFITGIPLYFFNEAIRLFV